MRACRFSSVTSGCAPSKTAPASRRRPPSRLRSGSRCSSMPRFSASSSASSLRALRRRSATASTRRSRGRRRARRRRRAATSVESMPPDSPITTCAKPFFAHVVARPEHERLVDLGSGIEQRCDVAATARGDDVLGGAPAARAGAPRAARRRTGGAQPRVVQPRRRVPPARSRSPTDSASSNCGARASTLPLVVDAAASGRRRPARPARRPCCRRRRAHRLSRARVDEHALALAALAAVVRRGRDVEDQRRAGQRLVATRARRASRCPRRCSRPTSRVAELDHGAAARPAWK